ncbi:MAG: hypothetical protein ACI9Z7_001172 [Alteromonas macleodii]|jgi:hypothetical protein
MIVRLLYVLCVIGICSCSNMKSVSSKKNGNYNAIVGGIGGDCGESRLLTLVKNDGTPTALTIPVYEINLPDSLRVGGLKLFIE